MLFPESNSLQVAENLLQTFIYMFESALLKKFYSLGNTQYLVQIFIMLAWEPFPVPWYQSALKFTLSLIVKQIHGNS